jgi:hypothetical protein
VNDLRTTGASVGSHRYFEASMSRPPKFRLLPWAGRRAAIPYAGHYTSSG